MADVQIPATDLEGAIVTQDNGRGRYALYKAAGEQCCGGFLVITRTSRRGKRRVEWAHSERLARAKVDQFFE